MNLFKFLLTIFSLLFFSLNGFCQNGGALRVTGYINSTGNLHDNQIINVVNVKITNSFDTLNCQIPSSGPDRNSCYVEEGIYKLICSIDGRQEVIVEGIKILSDRISFVDVLFEPEREMTRREKRKRNKIYSNKF